MLIGTKGYSEFCPSPLNPFIPKHMNTGYQRNSTIYGMLIQSINSFLKNLTSELQHIAIYLTQ